MGAETLMPAAELLGVTKKYGAAKALDDVSLTIKPGEAVALLGPNGAGKSTACALLSGLKSPTSGSARIYGCDPQIASSRKRIGVAPQEQAFQHAVKVIELIEFTRAHFDCPLPTDLILEQFDLAEISGKYANTLSGGQQHRLSLALAFSGNPDTVFLDEPTNGLDAASRQSLWNFVANFQEQGGTVLLTTHYLEDADRMAERVIVLNNGRVVRDGTIAAIKKEVAVKNVRFSAASFPDFSQAVLIKQAGDHFTFASRDADELVRELVGSGVSFGDLEIQPATLEQAIAQIMEQAE